MFKTGEFVVLKCKPDFPFIVTRILYEGYIAVGDYDCLDGFVQNEYRVKAKYFRRYSLNHGVPPNNGSCKWYLEALLSDFVRRDDGTLKFIAYEPYIGKIYDGLAGYPIKATE